MDHLLRSEVLYQALHQSLKSFRVTRGTMLAVMAAAFCIFALAVERNRMKVLLDALTWLSIWLATAFACNQQLRTPMKPLSFQAHDIVAISPAQDAGWLYCGLVVVPDWACRRR
jgi:hypothetical protein